MTRFAKAEDGLPLLEQVKEQKNLIAGDFLIGEQHEEAAALQSGKTLASRQVLLPNRSDDPFCFDHLLAFVKNQIDKAASCRMIFNID